MRLPRDLSGHDLAKLLRRYGYQVVRQTGSHLQLKTVLLGHEHQVTVPAHKTLKIGTLNAVISRVATYLEIERSKLAAELFEK